jgi:hypothetical protein
MASQAEIAPLRQGPGYCTATSASTRSHSLLKVTPSQPQF